MPKATRFSPSYERRRSAQYASRSSSESSPVDAPSPPSTLASPPPSTTTTSRSSSKHSMGYIRGRISSGLHSPATATATSPVGIASESYLRIKKKGALTTWSTRFLVLRGSQLVWFSNKQDAQWRRSMLEMQYVEHGTLTTLRSNELGLAIKTTDGKEYVARAFDRGDLAKWITAFQRLALKREAKRLSSGRRLSETLTADSTETAASDPLDDEVQHRRPEPVPHAVVDKGVDGARHVSFHNSVLVRMIPTVTDDQIPELFYSREDMEKFSARASSLLCRTEEAVSCAVLAIRRPSSISCKGTELSLCRREMEIA